MLVHHLIQQRYSAPLPTEPRFYQPNFDVLLVAVAEYLVEESRARLQHSKP
jgi:hypothetical protein